MNEIDKSEVTNISDIVGEWGNWQKNLAIFVFILTAVSAYTDMSYSFHSFETDFWCKDVPIDKKNKITEYINKCYKYENQSKACDQWDYDRSEFKRTINSEFDLVCERSNYASLTQSFYMFGFLISGLVLSPIADKFGRKPLVWISFIIAILALISSAVSVNITQYSISRLLVGLSIYGCSGAMCTSLLESCGPKYRSDIYIISGFGWVLGYIIIPGLAFWLKDFRYMNWFALLPIIFLMFWFNSIPESPRWLISNGRLDRAEQTLRNILKQNRLSDKHFDQKFLQLKTHLIKNQTTDRWTNTYTILDLLKTTNLRKYTLIFWFSWAVIGLVYYGFSLNMSAFGGNFYITFLLSGAIELPSSLIAILALRYIGRKKVLIGFLAMTTISTLAIIPITNSSLKISFALIGKFSVVSLWWVYEVYISEVYPTVLRNTGSGTAASFSRFGSMASPFMKNLAANTSLSVVMILYAIFSAVSAILVLFLPETKGMEIPETVEEVERRKDKYIEIL